MTSGNTSPPDATEGRSTLGNRAVHGTAWTVVGGIAMQLIRLGSNMVLSRLLFPGAFGLMLVMNSILQGLNLLSDLGTSLSVVRHPRGDERRFLDTVWTIQAIRGGVLSAICLAAAIPAARVYDEPQLAGLLAAAAAIPLLQGFLSTGVCTLQRHLEVGWTVRLQLAARLVGTYVMILWALVSPSVWALVAGQVTIALCLLFFSHTLINGFRDRFAWDQAARRDVLGFGRWIVLSTALTFFSERFDKLLLGKLLDWEILGLYGFALMVAEIPGMLVAQLGSSVLFPVLSKVAGGERAEFDRRLAQVRELLFVPCGFAVVALVLGAPLFFSVLFDPRYHGAGWLTQLLAGWCWLNVIRTPSDRALLALGDSRSLAFARTAQFAGSIVGILGGHALFGVPGVIAGVTAGSLVGYLVIAISCRRDGLHVLGLDLKWTVRIAAVAGLGFGLCHAAGALHPTLGRWAPVPLVAVLGVATLPWVLRRWRER